LISRRVLPVVDYLSVLAVPTIKQGNEDDIGWNDPRPGPGAVSGHRAGDHM
jgi:hypothetical protein